MDDKKTYPLTIYLLKPEVESYENAAKVGLTSLEIGDIGKLFYKSSYQQAPIWMGLFSRYNLEDLFSSTASALFLVKASGRIFAIPFGPAGRYFLGKGLCEERFGLITTLNSIEEGSLRSIDTKTLESEGIQTRIQSSRPNAADSFGLDVDRDLISSVTGESKDVTNFGKNLTGKDSLRISLKCNLSNIKNILSRLLEQFGKNDYKTKFPWIDNLKEISDLDKIAELEGKLKLRVNDASAKGKLWLTVPDILDWADHGGFKYDSGKKSELLDDIHMGSFKQFLDKEELELDDLKNNDVYRFSQSNDYEKDHWKIYECIYFEYSNEDQTCFLSGGKWYEVKDNLVETVNNYYARISTEKYSVNFIDYNHKDENDYNSALATANDALLVDANLIKIEGQSKFEFCDVYTKNKQLIHIKKYSRSSVLSHLFNQGYVSANFLMDYDFREKINEKLANDYKISNTTVRPNQTNGEYTVIFGIVSKSGNSFDLPFFSKMTLMHVTKDLINRGFKVSLVQIKNVKPDKVEIG
jgi:uncharacterized protein (TIGR04141 family)